MSVCIYHSFDAVQNIWLQLKPKTPFQTFEWNNLFWEHLRGNKELFIFSNGDAVLPMQRRQCEGLSVLELVGSRGTDYLDCLGSRFAASEIFEFILEQKIWDVLRLEDVPATSDLCVLKTGNFLRNIAVNVWCRSICLPASQSIRTVKDISYYHRKLRRSFCDVRFVFKDRAEQLCNYLSLHETRQMEKRSKVGYSVKTKEFLCEFFRQMAQKNLLYLSGLYINGELAAAIISVRWGCKIFACYTGFSSAYKEYDVGWVLYDFVLKESCLFNILEYDLSRGDESYKSKLGGSRKQNMLIEIYKDNSFVDKYKKVYKDLYSGIGYEPNNV